jgi:hypothetical protein
MSELAVTAAHEAGHAIVTLVLGYPVEAIEVWADGSGSAICRNPRVTDRDWAADALIDVAGLAGQRLLGHALDPQDGTKDLDNFNSIINASSWASLPRAQVEATFHAVATDLLHRHRTVFRDLATRLAAQRSLSAADLESLQQSLAGSRVLDWPDRLHEALARQRGTIAADTAKPPKRWQDVHANLTAHIAARHRREQAESKVAAARWRALSARIDRR